MISTSTEQKILIACLFLLTMVGGVSADFYYNDGGSGLQDQGYSIPSYDSQEEIFTDLVAPLLLITVILQIGFEKVLRFTLADDDHWRNTRGSKKERRKIRKQSTIMALLVSGMMIPTTAFQILKTWISFVYGSVVAVFFAVLLGAFTLLLIKNFGSSNRGNAE